MNKTKNNLIIAGILILILGLLAGIVASMNITWNNLFPSDTTSDTSDSSSDSSSEDPEPAGLALNKASVHFAAVGDTAVLTATVAPANASNKSVTWATSDAAKISIFSHADTLTGGTATIKAEQMFTGNVTITATTVDGGFTATCTVTSYVDVESMILEPIVNYPAVQGENFLYYNGSTYFVKENDGHEDEEVYLDLVVSPANAVAVSSTATFLSQPNWISAVDGTVSPGVSGSYLRGAIAYDAVEDTATIPIKMLLSIAQDPMTVVFQLDAIEVSIEFSLYIPVTGVSVNPPTYNF